MNDLKDKLNKAKAGWSYLWSLLEKEAKREKVKAKVLTEFYKYQVELYSTKYKLDFIEKQIKLSDLSKEEHQIIDEALSMHISNFQAIAFTIENLLHEN